MSLIPHLTALSMSLLPSQWDTTSWPPAWACCPMRAGMTVGRRWERDRRETSSGRGQERCFSLKQSISEPLRSHKELQRILHLSSNINTQTSHHIDVVSHCNMILYPELQIDHSAHTGDGLNQSSGNWLSKHSNDASLSPSYISSVKIRRSGSGEFQLFWLNVWAAAKNHFYYSVAC